MSAACTLELHHQGQWHDVARIQRLGDEAQGWRARCYGGYGVEWAFEHTGARDAHALCAAWPVGLEAWQVPHWPVFLIDMLPQGFGRQEMLRRLGLNPNAGEGADWRLLMAGAGHPIGHLRVKEAAAWCAEQPGPLRGFTDAEVAERSDDFAEHLAAHGLFVAGSSGVQGEWPKILLTRAEDGLLYLDHALPDERAVAHYIVKFGRGANARLASILHHEAPYMAIARHLGLRVHAPLVLRQRALFIPRFDRVVRAGQVIRLAQESVATLTGLPGFDAVPSHDAVCAALLRHCTDPQTEMLEYLRRDVANLALLNKDNHARNTAVQRDFAGRVALTPLFDFAPMVLHPDGIARRIRWEGNDHGRTDWSRVIDRLMALAADVAAAAKRRRGRQAPPVLAREPLVVGLRALAPRLRELAQDGPAWGLAPELLALVRPACLAQAEALERLA
ncbi:type II toxin-antitoxin system HipA family toxin [Ideonella livida]|uniref:HipA domain-containing protein n=1 Tax=Ideonella livida TaxID=2707176 RepID=A0A7C9TLH9_9BURK|nr:HipA domain-containing protein [Ideonella livida]NDY93540.1 HipA domain-containing protein [Ideonella livida]